MQTQKRPEVLIGAKHTPGPAGRVNYEIVGLAQRGARTSHVTQCVWPRHTWSSAVGVQPHSPVGWRSHFASASW